MPALRRSLRVLALLATALAASSALSAARPLADVRAAPLGLAGGILRTEPPLWLSAYRATEIDRDGGAELVVPRFVHDVGGRRTVVHVLNVGSATANVTLEPRTAANSPVACVPASACVLTLAPGDAALLDAAAIGLTAPLDGQARLLSDGWITAAVLELSDGAGGVDTALDLALSRDFPGPLDQFFPALPRAFPSAAGAGTA